MQGLREAQRNYDRQVPEVDMDLPEFTDTDVEVFIHELSYSDDPARLLETYNGGDPLSHDVADLLQAMAKTWQTNSSTVYEVVNSRFWQMMKQYALEKHAKQLREDFGIELPKGGAA